MGRKPLEDQAKNFDKAAGTVNRKWDKDIRQNLKGTPQLVDYDAAIKKYDPDGCADRLADCASTLKGIAKKLPKHSPKSNPTSRRLKRQGRL